MDSREEYLLNAIAEDENLENFESKSREEEFLKRIALGENVDDLGVKSRKELLLKKISEKGGSGGVIEPLTITENGTYTAPEGVNGYNPVEVNVQSSGGEVRSLKNFFDNIKSMYYMFYTNNTITDLTNVFEYDDTSEVVDTSFAFYQCKNLANFPKINLDKVKSATYMFSECRGLKLINLSVSEATNISRMFYNNTSLETVSLTNTNKVTNWSEAFQGCSKIQTINLNTDSATTIRSILYGCTNLKTITLSNTSNVSDIYTAFKNCTNLENIVSPIDMNGVPNGNAGFIFDGCSNIKNFTFLNIRGNLQIGSATYGNLINFDSLVNTVKELINLGSPRTLTMGSTNLEKIANTYVKFVDPSQTTIATQQKGEVELCESTDEGAMTLTQYATLKNWTLA